jgi:hypothetical protein
MIRENDEDGLLRPAPGGIHAITTTLRLRRGAGRDISFAHFYCALGMAVLRRRNCQIIRPSRYFAKIADGLCRYFDVRVHFHPHSIWQATKRELERSDAFGLVSHESSPGR